jgi:hypothetical protein
MRYIFPVLLLTLIWSLTGCALVKKKETRWLGSPWVSTGKISGVLTGYQIGFRNDGVIVWRQLRTSEITPAIIKKKDELRNK